MRYQVSVVIKVDATSQAEAVILVQQAIDAKTEALATAGRPARLFLESVYVKERKA